MDLGQLAKIFTADGPFVSIYLDTTSEVEDAAHRLEVRWQNVVRDLADRGVDAATVDALTAARGDHGNGNTRVLIAAQGTVHLALWLPEPPPRDIVEVGALPHLLPLVEAESVRLPHVVVLADRTGADVLAYTGGPLPAQTASVHNDRFPDHKVHAGGWAAKRYSNDVEETWEQSARDVAGLVDRVARDVDARLIVLSGDERALQLVRRQLPATSAALVTEVGGGGRADDGGDVAIADGVLRALGERLAHDTLVLLERFAQERGQQDRASDGLGATVAALRMAQVGTLLLGDALDRTARLWFGPEPTQLATTEAELVDLGLEQPQAAAAPDVLIRAALGTGAEIRFVPGGLEQAPADGVGGLLRFATP